MKNCISIAKTGYPALPMYPLRILIPSNKKIINIYASPTSTKQLPQTIKDQPIIPQQSLYPFGTNLSKKPFEINAHIYNSKEFLYNHLYTSHKIGYCKGYPILSLSLRPINYVPADGKLVYYPEITVTIEFEDMMATYSTEQQNFYRNRHTDIQYVKQLVQNPDEMTTYTSLMTTTQTTAPFNSDLCDPSESYDYVIITNNELRDVSTEEYNWTDLANHRETYGGLSTTIVTVEDIYACSSYWDTTDSTFNDSATKVRNFIIDAYEDWETEYVLLGGDWDTGNSGNQIVPTRIFTVQASEEGGDAYGTMPSDIYYSNIDGDWYEESTGYWGGGRASNANDPYAEVNVGRLTVTNASQISNIVQKILWYDLYAPMNFTNKTGFFGGELGWQISSTNYMEDIKDSSDPHFYECTDFADWNNENPQYPFDLSRTAYGDSPDYDDVPAKYKQLINSNSVCLINHLSHGNPSIGMDMTSTELQNLYNTKYFFSYSGQCLSGRFTAGDTAEKAVTCLNGNGGAFAVVWNTGYGWGSSIDTNGTDQYLQRQFWHYMFNVSSLDNWQIGKAHHYSKDQISTYINNDDWHYAWVYSFYSKNLFGDPAQRIKIEGFPHDTVITDIDVESHLPSNYCTTVDVTVMNLGTSNETDIYVSFREDGIKLSSQTISQLNSSESKTLTFSWTTPSIPSDGVITITANASVTLDNNTRNNEMSSTVIIGEDIEVSNLVTSDVEMATNSTFSANVANLGNSTHNNIDVNFLVDDIKIKDTSISLSPNAEQIVTFQWDGVGYSISNHNVEIYATPVTDENYTENQNQSSQVFVYAPINITNIQAAPDPQDVNGYVNISCTIFCAESLNTVKTSVYSKGNRSMSQSGNIYYYNVTYPLIGEYQYDIYASTNHTSSSISGTFTVCGSASSVHNVEQNKDYSTIQQAINDANPNDTIHVPNGTYKGNIIVNETVKLTGESNTSTIINAANISHGCNVTANYVSISNFSFKYSGGREVAHASGIILWHVKNCSIFKNNFSENTYPTDQGCGVYSYCSPNATIHHNTFYDNEHALYIRGDADYTHSYTINNSNNIYHNTFTKCGDGDGITIYKAVYNTIANNSFAGFPSWDERFIFLYKSHYNTIGYNAITDVDKTQDWGTTVYLYYSDYNAILHNNIRGEIGCSFQNHAAFSISQSRGNQLKYNLIQSNRNGIAVISSPDTTIENCTLIGFTDENTIQNQHNGITIDDNGWQNTHIEYCNITNFTTGVNLTDSTDANTHEVHHSDIYDNLNWGVWNNGSGTAVFNATNCYWGAPNGPCGNGSGSGDKITENVMYHPYSSTSFFQPAGNQPPVVYNINPSNDATGVSVNLSQVTTNISDAEGNLMTWSIEVNSEDNSSSTGASNTTISCSLTTPLAYSTTYTWYVNATDTGSGNWTNKTYHFTTTESTPGNNPPSNSNPNPANGATEQNLNPILQTDVGDSDGDTMNITFRTNVSDSWSTIGTNNTVNDGTYSQTTTNLYNYSTVYWWSVNTTDGQGNWDNDTYHFTTRSKYIPGTPNSFTASANGRFQIYLNWTKGNKTDKTYIRYKAGGSAPSGRNDGTFLYNDTGTSTTATGLEPDTQYSFKAWSWNETDNCFSISATTTVATTTANTPPSQSNENPSDSNANVSISTSSLSVDISDGDGDNINWTIETSPNIGSSSGNNEGNGTKTCTITSLTHNTSYIWYVNVTDNYEWNNQSYTFTTESASANNYPIFSGVTPSNGSAGVSIGISLLTIVINDSGGDLFNWSIKTSSNIGNNSGTNEGNGTKTCNISGLSYDTIYTWYVNATDTGSGNCTNMTYHFTTESHDDSSDDHSSNPSIPPQNSPPSADAGEAYAGCVNQNITFNGSGSSDSDGSIENYTWDFGDGYSGYGKIINYSYSNLGNYTVNLTVTDNEGETNTDSTIITIYENTTNDTKQNTTNNENISNCNILDDDKDGIVNNMEEKLGSDPHNSSDVKNITINNSTYYLVDINHDGRSDIFYNPATGNLTTLGITEDGELLIDVNEDGVWDYSFDIDTHFLTPYKKMATEKQTPVIEITIAVIIAAAFLGIMAIFLRKWGTPYTFQLFLKGREKHFTFNDHNMKSNLIDKYLPNVFSNVKKIKINHRMVHTSGGSTNEDELTDFIHNLDFDDICTNHHDSNPDDYFGLQKNYDTLSNKKEQSLQELSEGVEKKVDELIIKKIQTEIDKIQA